jgi:hypothetical protein
MAKEEEISGALYIISLANDIDQLANYHAALLNVYIRIETKYPNLVLSKLNPDTIKEFNLEESDQNLIINTADQLRSWCTRIWIKANALSSKLEVFKDKEIENTYRGVIANAVPELDKSEKFNMVINTCFVDGVLQDILIKARDLYSDVIKE